MRNSKGKPISPGDVMPRGMCQPPVDAMALIKRLSPEEAQRFLHVVAIWVPEALQKGLRRVSEERALAADFDRECAAAAAHTCGLGGDEPSPGHCAACQARGAR